MTQHPRVAAVQDLTLAQAHGTCGVGGISLYLSGFVGGQEPTGYCGERHCSFSSWPVPCRIQWIIMLSSTSDQQAKGQRGIKRARPREWAQDQDLVPLGLTERVGGTVLIKCDKFL